MNDEDFDKVKESLTVSPVAPYPININRASVDVLRSMGIGAEAAQQIVENRKDKEYKQEDITNDAISGIAGLKMSNGNLIKNYLTATEGVFFKVSTTAIVGGYTKQVEAILNGINIVYWKAL
jgi:type II secretory pathway component PulK